MIPLRCIVVLVPVQAGDRDEIVRRESRGQAPVAVDGDRRGNARALGVASRRRNTVSAMCNDGDAGLHRRARVTGATSSTSSRPELHAEVLRERADAVRPDLAVLLVGVQDAAAAEAQERAARGRFCQLGIRVVVQVVFQALQGVFFHHGQVRLFDVLASPGLEGLLAPLPWAFSF